MKRNKVLFCILGKSGSGKDTLTKIVSERLNLPLLVSHTTREMRTGETDGVEYHFVPDYIFGNMLVHGDFVETTTYHIESENRTYKYGYSKRVVDNCEKGLCIVNPHGLRKFIEAGYNVVAIEIYRNERDRMLSYLQRDENANVQELFDRYKRDEEDFEDLMSDFIVFNDGTIEDGVQQLETIIKEELFFQFVDGELDKI